MEIYSISTIVEKEWEIKSLLVTMQEWKELSDLEKDDICKRDAEEIFQTLYHSIPALTFRKLLERFDKYNNEVDNI